MMQERPSRQPWQREWLVEEPGWFDQFREALREFLQPASPPPRRVPGAALYTPPRLEAAEPVPCYRVLWQDFSGLFRPEKEAPLKVTSKPVAVPDIWQFQIYRRQARRTALVSMLTHAAVLLLVLFPFVRQSAQAEPEDKLNGELVDVTDLTPYKLTLPPSTKKAGGGGGGGERNPLPASKGRLPRFSLSAQLTPPAAVIRNPNPKLTAEPTVVVPPDITIQSPNMAAYGDPLAGSLIPSGGPGSGGGIGTGSGGGVGSGYGPGVGPGRGGGTGGGVFRIGGNVSAPACIYCPDPEYSEEARKARHQGVVVLWAVVDENGRPTQIRVQKSLGLGLDEAAIRAVQNWRFRPAERFGKPVPVYMAIEVDFHLY